jgi:2',3'-cyclic-nucleotide 2'-phosphodiesterase
MEGWDKATGAFRLLMVGDVVGEAGVVAACETVPRLRRQLRLDAVVINAENSAPSGFGVTPESAEKLLSVADFLTLGDHAFDQDDIGPFLDSQERVVRPMNAGADRPGSGWGIFEASGARVGVANVQGTVFMGEEVASPFEAADRAIEDLQVARNHLILVDFHAEATSEKQALGFHLAGRVAAVFGTHTHVPTADARVLPGGTAYVTDVGMTGVDDSIIGFDRRRVLTLIAGRGDPGPPVPAEGPTRLDAVLLEAHPGSGEALSVVRVFE